MEESGGRRGGAFAGAAGGAGGCALEVSRGSAAARRCGASPRSHAANSRLGRRSLPFAASLAGGGYIARPASQPYARCAALCAAEVAARPSGHAECPAPLRSLARRRPKKSLAIARTAAAYVPPPRAARSLWLQLHSGVELVKARRWLTRAVCRLASRVACLRIAAEAVLRVLCVWQLLLQLQLSQLQQQRRARGGTQ
jgi:hypothetical protein